MKDEDSTKVNIDTKLDFTILDNENLQIVTSHQSALNDVVAAHQVEVIRLKDDGIRQALVKLGWTPPGMAPRASTRTTRAACRGSSTTCASSLAQPTASASRTQHAAPPPSGQPRPRR